MADFALNLASWAQMPAGEAKNGQAWPRMGQHARGEAQHKQKCPLGGERRAQKWPPGAGPEAKRANFAINLASAGAWPAQMPK